MPNIVIQGVAGSSGTATGVARLVSGGIGEDPMGNESVLVTGKTTPTMTPLLLSAAAVVTDLGGIVSHAAVVARELGIPCVVGCGDATERIPVGALVRVDGDRGIVEVLKDDEHN